MNAETRSAGNIEDPWLRPIAYWIRSRFENRPFMTADVLEEVIKLRIPDHSLKHAERVEGLLVELGCQRVRREEKAGAFQVWNPPAAPASDSATSTSP